MTRLNSRRGASGRINDFWLSFGDHDMVEIIDMRDKVSAATVAMAIAAGGSGYKRVTGKK